MLPRDRKRLGALLMVVGVLCALPALLLGHLPMLGALGLLTLVTGSLLAFDQDAHNDRWMPL